MEKLVSIIIPAYNVRKYIKLCLAGVINQSYKNYEVIIVDDGSTDGTSDICDEFAEKTHNVEVIHTKNNGAGKARNIGLDYAKGDYICFVDADDMIEHNYIEGLVEGIKGNDLAICKYDTVLSTSKKVLNLKIDNINQYTTFQRIFNTTENDNACCGYLWNKLFKKSILDEYHIRFQNQYIMWEDMHFCCRYVINVNRTGYVNAVLYHYNCKNNESISHKLDKNTMDLWVEAAENIEVLLGKDLSSNTGYNKLLTDLYMKKLIFDIKSNKRVKIIIFNYLRQNKKVLRKKYRIILCIYILNPKILMLIKKFITI